MKKVWVIIRKEWAEIFRNRLVIFSVSFMPLIFTAIPLGLLYGMRGALIVLPLVALFLSQIFGVITINQTFILIIAGALVLVDAALMYSAIQLFQRETILTRWK
jgi:ABC-2 type transport system permease protein